MNYSFDDLDGLMEFLNYNNLKISDLQITLNKSLHENHSKCKNDVAPEKDFCKISIKSLSDSPVVTAEFSDENVIFVESCDSIKNSCSTAKVKLFDSEIYCNVCNMDGINHINLDVLLENGQKKNLCFKVIEDKSQLNTVLINRNAYE